MRLLLFLLPFTAHAANLTCGDLAGIYNASECCVDDGTKETALAMGPSESIAIGPSGCSAAEFKIITDALQAHSDSPIPSHPSLCPAALRMVVQHGAETAFEHWRELFFRPSLRPPGVSLNCITLARELSLNALEGLISWGSCKNLGLESPW